MAITVKALKNGTLATGSLADIYGPAVGKSAIIKSMRLVNKLSSAVTVNLKINTTAGSETYVMPPNTSIPAYSMIVDDSEITLQNSDVIRGSSGTGSAVDYLFSGIERDV